MTDTRSRRLVAVAATVFLMAACLPVTKAIAQTQPAEVTPLRMVLNLRVGPAKASDQIRSGKGRMTVEITGSRCTGYKTVRRIVGDLHFAGGTTKLFQEATLAENGDGTELAFSFLERLNGKVKRQESAVARKTPQGVVVTSRQLPGGRVQLPADILLPLHFERLTDAAVRDRKSLAASTYNPENALSSIERVTYRVGDEVKTPLPKGHPATVMADAPRYRVEILHHDKNGNIRIRENMTRYLNGITTVFDALFEDSRVKADLASMTLLPQKPCP